MISLSSLSMGPRQARQGTQPQGNVVAITAFSADRIVFDSGAGFGRAVADVPLNGTGTPGEIVQARAVSLDDGGATSTAWTDIGSTGAGGGWTGILSVPRGTSWYRPEVRLKSSPAVQAQGARRFGVGHVIAIWGQSEPERILSTFYDNTAAPAVSDPEAVQILVGAAATPARHFVTTAQPYTAAVAAMAATLIAARPGEKFAVVFQCVSGTDPRALVDDTDTSRLWSGDKALHDFATADGQHVGLAAMSWFAAPGSLGSNYGQALFPLFSGKTTAGATVSFPATITYGSGSSYQADHWFGELYDYTRTKWVPYGPHRFDIDGDMQDATHYVGGAQQFNLVNKQAARASWRAMLGLPTATMFLPLGLEPLNYVNGFDDGAGSWTDTAHPAGNTVDGTQAWARLTALAVLQSAGLTGWQVPVFDNCLWDPAGAWVEVWSSAGPVTTTRRARGEPALGTGFPHWTEVMGFQINGQPARNVQIVAGRVRIMPNGGVFTHADAVQYGEGGSTGALQHPEDYQNAVWKNLPIVDVGAPGLAGVSVRAMPSTAVLANTLPASSPTFTTSAGGPYFLAPANVPAGTTAITFAGKFRFAALPGTTAILFSQSSTGFDVELMNNGDLRTTIEDGTGAKMVNAVILPTALAVNVWYEIICSADQVAKVYRVMINGTLVATVAFSATGNGLFQSNRMLSFLARNSATQQYEGQVEYLKVWHSATGNGTAPTTTPFKTVQGAAATVNADSWKQGVNAT